ncbi:OLC1v1011140C1 [Oldenlandia corymbosa var. corymbosa]|uniref:OLC1v1011140C1 n=1 Tax=Oldenlandia corymbosa var. corymbosa TaxID=529605 RepID=A0AAV1DT62_OLDCO|nr:OLC1v1011140C1 [Oldenlandia corymbosa var. corymbosa]
MSPQPTLVFPNSTSPPLFLCNSHKLYQPTQKNFVQIPTLTKRASSTLLSLPHSVQSGTVDGKDYHDETIIGDCLVFEDGIFDDPSLQNEPLKPQKNNHPSRRNVSAEVVPENLIPEKWVEVQRAINITKKDRRKLAHELEFGRTVEKRRASLRPIGSVNAVDFVKYRDERLKQLKPIVLDKPEFVEVGKAEESDKDVAGNVQGSSGGSSSSARVKPRNPRLAVYGGGLEDISEFFNSGNYDPNAAKTTEGPRKLFSKEEKLLLNKRIPDVATATSGKWQPLHTLVASGEFYLVNALLKHNVDINVADKDGLTAIHRAILGKKQAIFNYLLRESINPFVRDKEGATLIHYAVRTASSQMIKILLLYNVDINLQDDDGWTPLHLAVQSRRTDIVRLLLIKGADKSLRNKDGLTPLELCLHFGRDTRTYELIKLLKQLPKNPSGG